MPAKTAPKTRRNAVSKAPLPALQHTSKKGKLIALLRRNDGQNMLQLTAALGWLPHTVRAAMTGLRKSGLNVERYTTNDGRNRYRVRSEGGR